MAEVAEAIKGALPALAIRAAAEGRVAAAAQKLATRLRRRRKAPRAPGPERIACGSRSAGKP